MSNLYSQRIVTADYYMHYPLQGFDPCYSDFRGASVKHVPVIRIFGTNPDGCKTCMHVHGALPYLYIPCPDYNQTELDTFIYQVAISLDKAINLSLGQSTSETQHVFKVVCVKAIPFYGYHPNEHRFLKIYFYNPMFIRRAANLLQNGAILNKIHQPHESHLPYLLQFFIDFNLYGMSFLHVPAEVVRYRRRPQRNEQSDESEKFDSQMHSVECTSVSECEIDISAAHILNRLEIFDKSSGCHANPGIASIWNDERCRRNKVGNCPPLDVPANSQETSKVCEPTESETFYRQALVKKLDEPNDSMSIIDEQNSERTLLLPDRTMKKFNLSAYLSQLVYPAECTNENAETMLNASNIVDHLSSAVNGKRNIKKQSPHSYADESIIDEDLVMSLSQRCVHDETLNDEDQAFLDVLRKLEANECEVDDDSILAPLSQRDDKTDVILSQKLAASYDSPPNGSHAKNSTTTEQNYLDEDDDLLNEFSKNLDDLLPQDIVQMSIPQMDGGADESPKRNRPKFQPLNITKSPKGSSSDSVVAMLKGKPEITVSAIPARLNQPTNQPLKVIVPEAQLIDLTETSDEEELATIPVKRPRLEDIATYIKMKGSRKILQQMDPLHIQFENGNTPPTSPVQEKSTSKVKLSPSFKKIINTSPIVKLKKISNSDKPTPRRYPERIRRPPANIFASDDGTSRPLLSTQSKDKQDKKAKKKELQLEDMYDWSDCKVAWEHDKKYNFFPEPGPSHINYYENVSLPGYYAPKTIDDAMDGDNQSQYDIHIQSMYEASLLHQSPISQTANSPDLLFNISDADDDLASVSPFQISTPLLHSIKSNFRNKDTYIVTPVTITPTAECVRTDLINYDLPQVVSKTPFYSNCDDVAHIKEVGNHIFQLPNLDDCESFDSSLIETGLNAWRRNIYMNIMSMDDKEKLQNKSLDEIREFFAVQKRIVIIPSKTPPSVQQVKLWLRNNQDCKKDVTETMDVDSPIKIKRAKAKIILENGDGDHEADDEDNSECDITLSCSPDVVPTKSQDLQLVNKHLTKAKKSLNSTFDKLKNLDAVRESPSLFSESESPTNEVCDSDDEIPSSQVITIKHVRPKNGNHVNGHAESSSNCLSDSSALVNSVNHKFGSSPYQVNDLNYDDSKSLYSPSHSFGITGATLENTFGFKMDLENFQTAKSHLEYNYLTTMSLEVHTQTRGVLNPDPQYDEINCLFYSIQSEVPENYRNIPRAVKGFICVRSSESQQAPVLQKMYKDLRVCFTSTEKELLFELLKLIALWDPDIFAGYEIEMSSWGYVIQRGYAIDINMPSLLSRVTSEKLNKIVNNDEERDVDGESEYEIKLSGRIFLNVWRLLRSEIALTSYTFENVMYHILHRRIPSHTFRDRTKMWTKELTKWIVFEYYIERCVGNLDLLNQLDLIGRTCELAKLFGIQFFEVLSRGSQFRVESMMLRIAKPRNIISVSPSVQQRAHMKAPEYLPLILEPHSRLYADPLIVLDFQSLYPSMIIAYNYCFSTCLGRVELLGKSHPFEFGASQLRVSPSLLRKLIEKDLVNISPCGAVFVKSVVREGVLPRMLREILDTRLMVKQSMKLHKNDKLLQKILHSRQLGLKLMANVTYGYTAANFSGRMPCVEVGDSVVSKGRETLERAIKMVQKKKKWESHVVYGDTDSLFVLCPGKSREEAFKIGSQIADAVTNDNPYPVKLKLEKVYQPAILQTKKRYVGFMYESPDQKEPTYEAKGIETVRRDGCPAVAKMLEKTLKLLFETLDVSIVKKYICRQFSKILSGRANIQDLIFAKEFRGIDGYKPSACVPALELTRKWKESDRRAEPRRGERVPYVIINGPPGVPLIRLVRSPHEYLSDEGLKINAMYYITKVIIPPLNRCLLLIGVDVNQWFADLPRTYQSLAMTSTASTVIAKNNAKKSTISQYFSTTSCVIDCGEQTQNGICANCQRQPHKSAVILSLKATHLERKFNMAQRLCESCCGRSYHTDCNSLDCPVLFVSNTWKRENKQLEYFRELLEEQFS
ncbi:DNA polymerase zeta catalytic subunit isoform X2 [Bradysia coprophila]|uniref:DNA polymerase zeta catalytic subunit isoform X2 n=1 Tax=Bradysia coprophila TaxID=38358 RepID=UPI00187DA9EB|nr:DNA polymerase zeta catalytic subunit isoform X2 [Bradysia coprophila]